MLWAVLLAVLVILVVWIIINDRDEALDSLPGPKKTLIIGNVLDFMMVHPDHLFKISRDFGKQYGDRYLLKIVGRRILHIFNPNDVEVVLSHTKNISKSKPYSFLQPWLGTGLLLSTGNKWHSRRKILTPTFHFNILKSFSTIIEEKSLNLVKELRRSQGQEQEVFSIISNATLYAICETAMGTQLDQDKSADAVEYKQAILQIGGLLLSRLTRVWLHSDIVFNNSEMGKQFQKVSKKVRSFADNVILERKRRRNEEGGLVETEDGYGQKKRMAMLDLLLEAESKGEIDVDGIREEVNTFMFEGHDTTATALTFGLMLIADHEEVQDRIYDEIQSTLGDRQPSMTDLAELKYLEAVIKEILRLYPSVPFIARETSEDFMMGDVFVRKGTEIGVHIYDLHRRPDQFPDPEAFIPDRFLPGVHRHPYAYVPFSAGPRNCIGCCAYGSEQSAFTLKCCHNRLFKIHISVAKT
ncbi:cytochrome p450 domain-containing protein [Phthorimaea operculella]|nr:cytochrome p450 domain-containing protein [Phthorimaea operculella]